MVDTEGQHESAWRYPEGLVWQNRLRPLPYPRCFQVQIGACCCLLLLPAPPSIFEYRLQPPCPKENDSTGLDTLSLGSSSTMCISFVVTASGIFYFLVGFKFYQCKGRVCLTYSCLLLGPHTSPHNACDSLESDFNNTGWNNFSIPSSNISSGLTLCHRPC